MKKNGRFAKSYLILLTVIMYIPIMITVFYSFNESKLSTIWGGFSLKWYKILVQDDEILKALGNSVILALASSILAILIGTLGAVGMNRTSNRFNRTISYLSTLPIMIPEIILGMVFLGFFSLLGFPFGMITLTIAHATFCIPYVFIMVKARLIGIDKSYEEASLDLGASKIQTFLRITVPLVSPAMLSGALLAFAMSFDDVVISIFTTGPTVNLLPIKIYTKLKTGVTPEINALATILLLGTIVFVVITDWLGRKQDKQKHSQRL